MIAKIGKGRNFAGLFRYLYGPGKQRRNGRQIETHHNPRIVAGNLIEVRQPRRDPSARCGYDVSNLTRAMLEVAAGNPRMKSTVWHTSLSAAPEDMAAGKLVDDACWQTVIEEYMTAMGLHGNTDPLRDVPWIAVRHGDNHVHIVACRVRYDGRAINDSHERYRSMKACATLERRHGLAESASPQRAVSRGAKVSRTEREMCERKNHGRGQGQPPVRLQLVEAVGVAVEAAGGDVERFHARLEQAGLVWRRTVAGTGRVAGYSFGRTGDVDAAGEQRWYRGSKLSRDLRWAQLACRLNAPPGPGETASTRAVSERTPDKGPAAVRTVVRDPELVARRVLAGKVGAALQASAGVGEERFRAELAARGVAWRVNVASTGRISGYAFAEGGEGRWWGGSKLHKSLAWSQLGPQLDGARRAGQRVVNRSEGRGEAREVAEREQAVAQQAHLIAQVQARGSERGR